MHLDGLTPEQILMAQRKSMLKESQDSEDEIEIIITTKEKIK